MSSVSSRLIWIAGSLHLKAKILLAVRSALGSLSKEICPVDAVVFGAEGPLRIVCRLQKAQRIERTFRAVARPIVATTKYAMSMG